MFLGITVLGGEELMHDLHFLYQVRCCCNLAQVQGSGVGVTTIMP
jgi:hypothetical protein